MSFGFSVGDFLAVIELAQRIRKEFRDAPSQFKAISDELRSLSIVVQDVDVVLSEQDLSTQQKIELGEIAIGTRNILQELEKVLDKHAELAPGSGSVGVRVKRVWKRLTWEPKDIQELRSRIVANIILLNTFQGRVSNQISIATKSGVDKLHERQNNREYSEERRTILDWLTPIDYTPPQNDLIDRRQEGTGQWLLESTQYQSWFKTSKGTLFCPGIPGAGKTILTSIVIEDLTTRTLNDSTVGIAYIYCNFRRQEEQKIDSLLFSLLKQLAERQVALPGTVKALYDQHKQRRTQISLEEVLRCLQEVISLYSRVFIIIDALDECQVADRCRPTFLSKIFDLQAKTGANFFATSRFIPDITEVFSINECIQLEIRASKEDVQRYLQGHMSQLPQFVSRKPKLQEEITAEISQAVDGMFLLAQLYLSSLEDKTTPKAIKNALKNFQRKSQGPSDDKNREVLSLAYKEAYEIAMERINKQPAGFQQLAKNVLSWITCAKRPLTTNELQCAMAVELDESELDDDNLPEIGDMVSVCAGLVTIDEESNIIRLVHYTTQEYFEQAQNRWFPSAETDITKICVTYLGFKTFDSGFCRSDKELKDRLEKNVLYDYASKNWGHHARTAATMINEAIIFLERRAHLEASTQVLTIPKSWISHHSQFFPQKTTGLHLAAHFGIKTFIQPILKKGADNSAADTYGQTPLHWASTSGHLEVVRLLLTQGADATAADTDGRTPLYQASRSGHLEVVRLLLAQGADAIAADMDGWTPLHWASRSGHVEVVRLLLAQGADATAVGTDGTPLHQASKGGHVEVVRLLLAQGADATAAGTDGTPLHQASRSGHVEVVRLLLAQGADATAADTEGWTPLHWASTSGHLEIVRLLLAQGADATAADTEGWTPLYQASRSGHLEVVRLLLAQGADATAADTEGWTPLHWASRSGRLEVVRLLLAQGADATAADTEGWTPLHWASTSGHLEIVRLLLAQGADAMAADTDGRTPLDQASRSGHVDVVQLLQAEYIDILE